MKTKLISFLIFLSVTGFALAQETEKKESSTLNKVVNTLKDRLTVEGYTQLAYSYDDSGEGKANTFEIKRAIVMVRGKITDRWTAYFMYNFANTGKILEAYTEYKFLPELTVRLGQFKTMFTFENPMSPCNVELINIYSQATNYLVGYDSSDPLYGSNAGRDLGLLIYGDLFGNLINYKLAVMNGQGINKKDGNNQKDIVGSLIFNPTKWLAVGGTFIKGKGCAAAVSEVNPDIAVGENYTRNRWSAGAMLKFKPIDIRTEFLHGKDGHVLSNGYYLILSAHILPSIDFIASYDFFNRNTQMDLQNTNYVAGLQWWFYPKCRLQVQYTRREPKHGEGSNLLQTQVQVRF